MFDDDYIVDEDLEQLDYSTPNTTKQSFDKGKQIGREVGKRIQDGSLKEDLSQVKEGISDIKSGDISDGLSKVKNGIIDDRNAIEKAGHDIKETGKAMQKGSEQLSEAGDKLKKANKVGEKVNDAVEKGAKGAKVASDALDKKGKMDKAIGDAGKATSNVVDTAGTVADATVAGAPVGAALNVIGKVGKGLSHAKQAEGNIEQGIGKAGKTGAGAVEKGAQAGKLGNKVGEKFGDAAKKAGDIGNKAGKKLEDVGGKIEQTGKDLKNELKPIKGTIDIAKNLPKILIILCIIAGFFAIIFLYYDEMSPISESMEKFTNFTSNNGSFQEVTSNLYTGENNKDYDKFYEELKYWYDKSNGRLDVPLVYSVLFFTDIDNSDNQFDFSSDEDDGEDYSDIMSLSEDDASDYIKGKTKRLRLICKNMLDSSYKPVSEEEFNNFLRNKYINKKPEFKPYLDGLDEEAKKDKIEDIINQMYEYREYYVQIYGDGKNAASSESYETSCVGAVDTGLASDLHLPVDITGTVNFDSNNSYGMVNGKVHNGVDLNAETAGVSEGNAVYSIHDGTVVEVKDTSSTTTGDSIPTDVKQKISDNEAGGTSIKIKHEKIVVSGNEYTFYSVYKNLDTSSVTLKSGDTVSKGDEIGKVGKTDKGTAQLHFEFRNESDSAIDPTNIFIECTSSNAGVIAGDSNEEKVWNFLTSSGYSKPSTAAAMGNFMSESGFHPDRVQGDIPYSNKSVEYTAKVDNGSYSESDFVNRGPGGGGYGLAQWTYYTRKQALYNKKKTKNTSIGDLQMQLEYLVDELEGPNYAWLDAIAANTWKTATEENISKASAAFCRYFENPAECASERQTNSQTIYDKYKNYVAPKVTTTTYSTYGEQIASEAEKYVGYPYVSGGNSLTEGCDCSHFVFLILQKLGYQVQYQPTFNWNQGTEISVSEAQTGDVFLVSNGDNEHMGFIGKNGMLIEAKGRAYGITYDRNWEDYKTNHPDVRVFRMYNNIN